jgi:predicted membrane-bound spermidine synthase
LPASSLFTLGALFFVSGASALVYQVSWQRILALHTGVGIESIAIIVAAFMAGLGLGSALGGVISARRPPGASLRAFALVELAIGAFGALSCLLYYDLLYQRAAWLYQPAWRGALLHFVALGLPTTFMGMSLPLLVRGTVAEAAAAGRTIGILYGLNVVGAATGALLTPWVLVRLVGIRGAVTAAAIGNVLAGLGALALATRAGGGVSDATVAPKPTEDAAAEAPASRPFTLWLLLYALGGFCALALEILWFRLIDVAAKSTAFTFGTVLTIYLLGYGAGTLGGARLVARVRRPLLAFVLCQCALLAWSGLAVAALAWLPAGTPGYGWFVRYWAGHEQFALGRAWDPVAAVRLYGLLPLFLYGVPTVLMGLSFPILQRAVHDDPATSGRKVGLLQAANIAGCVAGSLGVGLVTLGSVGTTGTLRILLLAGLVFVAVGLRAYGLRPSLAAAGVVLAVTAGILPGQRALWLRLHGGISRDGAAALLGEDATGVAAIVRSGSGWRVFVDGKSHSWIPFGGIHTWLGAIPAMVHDAPQDIAIIGLGSGNTAWAAAARPETRNVTVFELSGTQPRLLRELAAQGGGTELASLLDDPRVHVRIADGRNALLSQPQTYDLIQADAQLPQTAYSGNLYSVEFFRLCASRLKPGGLMVTWAPTRRVATSFRRAFPHVLAFDDGQILVGGNDRPVVYVATWRARAESESSRARFGPGAVRLLVRHLRGVRRVEGEAAGEMDHDLFPRDEFAAPDR